MNAPMRQLIELGRAWWRADRIRVSGRASHILRLAPGSALRVGGTKSVVRTRTVEPRSAPLGDATLTPPTVRYACLTAVGPAELEVRPRAPGEGPELVWRAGGLELDLNEADVHVYHGRPRSRGGGIFEKPDGPG